MKIKIEEFYLIEGPPVEFCGKQRYFGIARATKFFGLYTVWQKRFYADVNGRCIEFDGDSMPLTSAVVQKYLQKRSLSVYEEQYVKLLESARKI